MDRQKIATDERITKAFEMFDIDKSGKIAADELRFVSDLFHVSTTPVYTRVCCFSIYQI